jgi:hypothetical protein
LGDPVRVFISFTPPEPTKPKENKTSKIPGEPEVTWESKLFNVISQEVRAIGAADKLAFFVVTNKGPKAVMEAESVPVIYNDLTLKEFLLNKKLAAFSRTQYVLYFVMANTIGHQQYNCQHQVL